MALHDDPTIRRDPTGTRDIPVTRKDSNRTAMNIIIVIAVILAVAAIAWAAGLFTVETEGRLAAPDVAVTGGSVPAVDVDTAEIDIGTRREIIEVPTVAMTPAGEQPE